MDHTAVQHTVEQLWDTSVLPSLSGLVEVPALSPNFDPEWATTGQLDVAIAHVRDWIDSRGLPGARCEEVRLPGRSPVLLVDVPATPGYEDAGTVLLYGHLDKQPPLGGWSPGLGPWTPVVRGESGQRRLYGRGAADDGYSGYAAITALEAVNAHGGAHARCVVLLETGEESGSPDLPAYLAELSDRLGEVGLVVCLDAGGGDYERMWLTTSLRGMAQARVSVRVLDAGLHSGAASGIVPSSFRVMRRLLDRIEDPDSGRVRLPEMHGEIPEHRVAEVREAVESAPGMISEACPLPEGVRHVGDDEVELALNGTWRPTMSVIGADGMPAPSEAGNVLRAYTTLALSFRLPPTVDSRTALESVRTALTSDVPYGARVEIDHVEAADGWDAPETPPWLRAALDGVSERVFGAPWRTMGLGGSIPFMGLLQQAYPRAQFVVTGVLGPGSNAHTPDESLHLDYAAKVTTGVAAALDAHARA